MSNVIKLFLGLVVAGFMMAWAGGAPAQDPAAMVKEAMKTLKERLAAYGAPRVDDGSLFFGDRKINENYEVVDEIKKTFGANATVFVKQRAAFTRISTNVLRGDGQRAVGTQLDPNGPVYPLISKGQPYYGKADILGKPYETGYEPILNAGNQAIGIYFVGLPLSK